MKRIKFVTALHGDEPIPVFALASKNIEQIVGNPKALCLNKRFVEYDMNKSFGTSGNTYEETRARQLLKQINENDIVIDLHTMSADSDPFAIVVDNKMIGFASTLGVKHIVYMKHNIKNGHALINLRNGVSIEAGKHNKLKTFENVLNIVESVNKSVTNHAIKVYEVFDIISEPGNYSNFTKHSLGFVPVLAGEKAYDFYGLKAKLV